MAYLSSRWTDQSVQSLLRNICSWTIPHAILASVNLRRFHDEATNIFDVEGFEYTARLWTTVLEVSVLMAQFPSKEVAQLSYDYRTLGLGYANLGSMLMIMVFRMTAKKPVVLRAPLQLS